MHRQLPTISMLLYRTNNRALSAHSSYRTNRVPSIRDGIGVVSYSSRFRTPTNSDHHTIAHYLANRSITMSTSASLAHSPRSTPNEETRLNQLDEDELQFQIARAQAVTPISHPKSMRMTTASSSTRRPSSSTNRCARELSTMSSSSSARRRSSNSAVS